MEIYQLYLRVHSIINQKIKNREMPLTRTTVKDFASIASGQLTAIISDPNESTARKNSAHKALFGLAMAEKDLEENLAK